MAQRKHNPNAPSRSLVEKSNAVFQFGMVAHTGQIINNFFAAQLAAGGTGLK
jgi:hypothetical protein